MKGRALIAGMLAAGLSAGAAAAEPGFYAGSGLGLYYVDIDDLGFDESAESLRVFGGYRMNEYVSFEAGFNKLFEASGNVNVSGFDVDLELDGTAWDVSVRPEIELAPSFTAFATLGWMFYDLDVTASAGGFSASDSGKDDDFMYGIGGAWQINDRWNVRGEWNSVDVSDTDFGIFSISAVYNIR